MTRKKYKPATPPTHTHALYYSAWLDVGDDVIMTLLHVKRCTFIHTKYFQNHVSKWPSVYRLDNRSYSTIQPPTFATYSMKIEVGPTFWEFFDRLSQKMIRSTHQNSHQTCKKLNVPHVIRSSSPVTNPSGELTNINLT